MKKIILILFLFLSCYLIYNLTDEKKLSYLTIGDSIANNPYIENNPKITKYNNSYINEDYRIIDLINIIKYNEEIKVNNKSISIHRLLKEADILTISVGMNDIYYKINTDNKKIYTYINKMVNNMDNLLSEIDKYSYQKVLVLGFYNINNNNNDIFNYLNYKMKKVVKEYKYQYIELNDILKNNPTFYQKKDNFKLNDLGYNEINKIIVEKLKNY